MYKSMRNAMAGHGARVVSNLLVKKGFHRSPLLDIRVIGRHKLAFPFGHGVMEVVKTGGRADPGQATHGKASGPGASITA